MITYKYKCLSCTCMFAKDEIIDFCCPICEQQGVNRTTIYLCKKCYPKKKKNEKRTLQQNEFFKKIVDLHSEAEHGPVNISEL